MRDQDKTKEVLIEELRQIRRRIAELESKHESTASLNPGITANSLLAKADTFRKMFQDHVAVMYIVDLESFSIIDANKAALRYYGYDLETMLTKRIPDLNITPEPEIRQEIKAARDQGRFYYVFKHRLANGDIRDVEVYANPILIKGREYSFSVVHDITDLRQAQDALKESEEEYRTLFESSNDAIFIMKNDNFIDCNQQAIDMFGYEKEKMLSDHPYKLSPEIQPDGSLSTEKAKEKLEKAFAGDRQLFEWVHRRCDGSLFDAEVSLNTIILQDKKYLQAVVRDITDRKQIERDLRNSLEFVSTMLDTMPSPVFYKDINGKYLGCNKAYEDYIGVQRTDLMGKTAFELWPKEFAEIYFNADMELLKSREKQVYEATVKNSDGEFRNVVFYKDVYLDSHCKPAGLIGVILDITDWKNTEKALSASQEALAKAQEIAHLGSWVWNIEENSLNWSEEVYRIFGLESEVTESTFERFIDAVHPNDRKLVQNAVDNALNRNIPYDIEHRIYRLDREERTVHELGEVIFNKDSKPLKMVGTVQDVTERKNAEQEIRLSYNNQSIVNSVLRLALEDIPLSEILDRVLELLLSNSWLNLESKGGIFLIDKDSNELILESKVGLPPQIEKDCARIPFGRCYCGKAAESKKILFTRGLDEDHETTYEGISNHGHYCAPILSSKGLPLGVIMLYVKGDHKHDQKEADFITAVSNSLAGIVERNMVENALKIAKEESEMANKAKSEFLANMSHELRTPLTAIIGFSEVLNMGTFGVLTENQKTYVNDIYESGEHLLSLINDILDLSKVESGTIELEPEKIRIHELLEGSLAMVKEKCINHGIELELTLSPDVTDLILKVDERRIKQVMYNLLSNAAKFTPDGGDISVKAVTSNGEIVISVSDTGVWISIENMEKVFEEFYQVKSGVTGKTPGTGLGLPLSRKIIELHGGKIWVDSKGTDKGSRFSFSLPLRKTS